MKKSLFLATCFLSLILNQFSLAQQNSSESPLLPLKSERSVLFGSDIIIHDQPEQNQQQVGIYSAFNGWLYAVYADNSGSFPSLSIQKSVDNGVNWITILSGQYPLLNSSFTDLSIVVGG